MIGKCPKCGCTKAVERYVIKGRVWVACDSCTAKKYGSTFHAAALELNGMKKRKRRKKK